jgi:Na+-transporting NADH:ubiquinone oxidoreductase subunit NqrE
VDFQDISRKIATSQGLSAMVAVRKVIFVLIVQINQLEDGLITGEASLKEVVDLYLEVAAARMGTEKEAVILGD